MAYGLPYPTLANSFNNMGKAYKALGKDEKGDEYIRQAKEMRMKSNQNLSEEGTADYENVIYWNIHELSPEDAAPVHTLLYENSIMLAGAHH